MDYNVVLSRKKPIANLVQIKYDLTTLYTRNAKEFSFNETYVGIFTGIHR